MLRLTTLLAVLMGLVLPATAQTAYPSRPVTLVVPYAAGGTTDLVGRVLAEEFSKIWKQSVVVENKPGGGAAVGTMQVARAKPDGYTLLMIGSGFVILPAVQQNLPYDTLKDFTPIGIFVEAPIAMVASPSVKQNSLVEVIAESKNRPDRPFTYATSGAASASRMIMEVVQRKTPLRMKHIGYQGEAAAIPDLISGRLDFQITSWSLLRPYVESKQVKLLAMLHPTRLPEAPDTPTLSEVIPDLGLTRFGTFNGLVVPAGTPKDVVDKISADLKTIVTSENFKTKVMSYSLYPTFTTPAETAKMVQDDIARWSDIAKVADIKME